MPFGNFESLSICRFTVFHISGKSYFTLPKPTKQHKKQRTNSPAEHDYSEFYFLSFFCPVSHMSENA
jgi:hypothetical protein